MKHNSFRKIICPLCIICACLFPIKAGLAQSTKGYTRKSISYTTALLAMGDFKISSKEHELFRKAVNSGIQIARFDYSPLPDGIQKTFVDRLAKAKTVTDDELTTIINTTLVPEIIRVLDLQKEMRAQQLVTDAQRNSFIALKAKESGVTAVQLEQVMNSSFLYIPFIDKYNSKKEKDSKDITVSISGGLLWYHIIPGEKPVVERIAKLNSSAYASANTEEKFQIDGQNATPVEYAFWSSANTLAMNLEVNTRELDMFKLSAPIAELQHRIISFALGYAEGVKLDDPFFVGEWIETSSGKIRFEKSGFVRVSTVSDNRGPGRQLSQATAIKKGDWSRGMMVIEHPRLGIDIAVRPRWFEVAAESGYMTNAENGFVVYFDNYSGGTVGMDMNFQWNIANLVRKRQTFLVLGGTVSVLPVKSVIFDYASWDENYTWLDLFPVENLVAGLYYGYVGYLKRFYLGPFAIHGEASLGTQVVSTGKVRGKDFYNEEDNEKVTISNYTVGCRLNVGLEYAVNIDWNVGVFAGVQAFPSIDWWTVKYDDDEIDIDNNTWWAAPKFYSYSPSFGIYVHFSPPTLPFNPVAIVQNQMKNIGSFE